MAMPGYLYRHQKVESPSHYRIAIHKLRQSLVRWHRGPKTFRYIVVTINKKPFEYKLTGDCTAFSIVLFVHRTIDWNQTPLVPIDSEFIGWELLFVRISVVSIRLVVGTDNT